MSHMNKKGYWKCNGIALRHGLVLPHDCKSQFLVFELDKKHQQLQLASISL